MFGAVPAGTGWGEGRVGIQLWIQAEFQAEFRLGGFGKSLVCKMFGVWGIVVQALWALRKLTLQFSLGEACRIKNGECRVGENAETE
ncbi:MAG: hypothetical protein IPK83_23170 [Planctomycetes bacterium]|nr:hypothetical protein [Planctomycetota bacterium]